jgi:hypothetical protein
MQRSMMEENGVWNRLPGLDLRSRTLPKQWNNFETVNED